MCEENVNDLRSAVCQVSEKLPELGNNRGAMEQRKPYIGKANRQQHPPLSLRGISTRISASMTDRRRETAVKSRMKSRVLRRRELSTLVPFGGRKRRTCLRRGRLHMGNFAALRNRCLDFADGSGRELVIGRSAVFSSYVSRRSVYALEEGRANSAEKRRFVEEESRHRLEMEPRGNYFLLCNKRAKKRVSFDFYTFISALHTFIVFEC